MMYVYHALINALSALLLLCLRGVNNNNVRLSCAHQRPERSIIIMSTWSFVVVVVVVVVVVFCVCVF